MIQYRYKIIGIALFAVSLLYGTNVYGQGVQEPNTIVYDHGITLFENGLYKKSAEELARFAAKHPHNALVASALFYRARAKAKTDPSHAPAYYRQYIERFPQSAFTKKIMVDLAHKDVDAGNFSEAMELYQRALHMSITKNQSAQIYYWMAQAEIKKKDYDQASQYFLTLANNYPKTGWAPKALYARGRLYLREKNYKASSRAFQLLKTRYPNGKFTRKAGMALGESYFKQNEYKKAIKTLKRNLPYLKSDEKDKAILLIAESYNALNEFKKSAARYLQYIHLTQGTGKERYAHYGLGWVYHKQKIYHWAAREFGEAAQGKDTLARKALYFKAVNEKMGGFYQKAIKTFREFGKRYSGGLWYEHVYYEWAITAYQMGNYGESIETLLKLVRSGKKLKMACKIYTLLGQAYFADKEYTRALQAYDVAEKMANIPVDIKRKARYQKAWMQFFNQAYKPAQKIFAALYHQNPDDATGKKALFWDANSYYQLHHYGTAASLFIQFIHKYPHDQLTGPARYSLGWSYFELGEYQKAIPPFQAFLRNYNPPKIALFPYNTDTRLRLGDSYYALSDYSKAIQTYKKSVGDDPGGDYALFQIGNCYFRADKIYQAVKTFRQFMKQFPKSSLREEAQYNIAYIFLNNGNFQQAITEFKKAIQEYPGTPWAARSQFNIGDAYYNAGEYQKAIAAYQKVMNNYPRSNYLVDAANGIRYARQAARMGKKPKKGANRGQPVDTSSVIENFIKNNPHNTVAADRLRYHQAEGLVQSGDYIKAIKKLKQYIRISNNEQLLPEAYLNLAISYLKTHHQADAVNAYQTVAAKYAASPQASTALAALGKLMYQQKKYKQSYQYYSQLANRGGHDRPEGEVGMGNAQLAMYHTRKARKHYQAALSADANYDAANVGLAQLAIKQGTYKLAEKKLKPVAQSNTTGVGAQAQYLLGVLQQRRHHYKQALTAYSKVRTLFNTYDNWIAKSMLHSAECYNKLGKKGEAQNVLQTLMKKYPQSPETVKARQLLREMK